MKKNSSGRMSLRLLILSFACLMLMVSMSPITQADHRWVRSLTLNPTSVTGGNSLQGTVTLNALAPTGGSVISLSSSNPAVAKVPATVTVPSKTISVTFTITTTSVTASSQVSITASYVRSQSAALTVMTGSTSPPSLTSLILNPNSVSGGSSSQATVTLDAAALAGGAVISLSSNNPSLATPPASVTMPAGAVSTSFPVATGSVSTSTSVNISATYNSITKTSSLMVTTSDTPPPSNGTSRGYLTTPAELRAIAQKASQNIQPYKAAVDQILAHAGTPASWSYGTISGSQSCGSTYQPAFIGEGNTYIYAKAMAYHLTGNTQYAAVVREKILDLTDTYGYGGETYSGGNQCILNLSWYMLDWIQAADLLEGYSGWTAEDKYSFQRWLANEIFKKVEWSSDRRSNNWGSAGSAMAAIIADYVSGAGLMLKDRTGALLTPRQAYDEAKQRQIDRIVGNSYMDNYVCHDPLHGIRPDGGIPEELGRGPTTCDSLFLDPSNLGASWTYQMVALEGFQAHAELLLRRGDRTLYDYLSVNGSPAILRAIHFILRNPNLLSMSAPWKCGRLPQLELAYRYYRDPYIGYQLGINNPSSACGSGRYIGGKASIMIHWGTITHGFAPNENPGPPPTVPPPGN